MKEQKNKHQIAPRIRESEPLPGLRLFSAKTGLAEGVVIRGSFLGGVSYAPENRLVSQFTAMLLDEGTKHRSKETIRGAIESLGAKVSFSAGDARVSFLVSMLKGNLPKILKLFSEELREPLFSKESLAVRTKHYLTDIGHLREDTGDAAYRIFTQALFPKGHPNRRLSIDELVSLAGALSTDKIRAFHNNAYGLGNMFAVVAGDIDHKTGNELVKVFKGWKKSLLQPLQPPVTAPLLKKKEEIRFHIPGKQNVDVFMGAPVGINDNHPDYIPLAVALFVLGGNFSSRLVMNVREKMGLTYGINAAIKGATENTDGFFRIWGTFAPSLYEKGRDATLAELKEFVRRGITEAELQAKKDTMRNSTKVGIETSGGLAGLVLMNAEDGKPLSYIDEMLDIVDALNLEEVNRIIKKYIDPDRVVIAAAGSIH